MIFTNFLNKNIWQKGIINLKEAKLLLSNLNIFSPKKIANKRRMPFETIEEVNLYIEEKVRKRTMELEATLATQIKFLNHMSHEIRTPITGVLNISEGLIEHWQRFDESKRLDLANQIAKNAKRLTLLVDNLLDLAKFNSGKMLLDLQEMDLVDTIKEIIYEYKTLYLYNKDIDIIFNAPTEQILVTADHERIGQVLRNLCANSIKFSPASSVITIELSKSDDSICCSITDSGIGIPPNELETIFQPFIQSSNTKASGTGIGTGLGLAIAREIITAHNGKIWAENNTEQGAIFNFVLPVIQNLNVDNDNTAAEKGLPFPKSATILMIDDETACHTSIEMILLDSNYNLIKARGGIEGLAYLKAHSNNIDLVLLDLMMPDMYGLNVLTEIKKDPKLADIPVILQTGSSDQAEIEKAYEMGAVGHIKKPYDKQLIWEIIMSILEEEA